jgi:hypothetical protein
MQVSSIGPEPALQTFPLISLRGKMPNFVFESVFSREICQQVASTRLHEASWHVSHSEAMNFDTSFGPESGKEEQAKVTVAQPWCPSIKRVVPNATRPPDSGDL